MASLLLLPLLGDILGGQPVNGTESSTNASSSTPGHGKTADQPEAVVETPPPLELSTVVRPSPALPPPVEDEIAPEHYRPSLLLKAYAHALRSFITLREDLSHSDQAFFIASPLQRGIPIDVKEEYSNEQLFQHANSVQSNATPVFQSAHGNYFEWLKGYFAGMSDVASQDTVKISSRQEAYEKTVQKADLEWESLLTKYERVSKTDSSIKFQEWMGLYGKNYLAACDRRDAAAKLVDESDLQRVKQIFDSAQARLESKPGNNMACSLQDIDLSTNEVLTGVVGRQRDGAQAASTSTIYRPLYFLSGYQATGTRWQSESSFKTALVKKIPISLKDAITKSWASLGFPHFDDHKKSAAFQKVQKDLDSWKIWMTCSGIESFDVGRGLWNIENPRDILPLQADASKIYATKIYKTTRLLLAYDVDLVIILPPQVLDNMKASDDDGVLFEFMPTLLQGIPFTRTGPNELHARLNHNNAYPVLLGCLADKC